MLSEDTENKKKRAKGGKVKAKRLEMKKPRGGFRTVFQHDKKQERL